MAIKLTSDKELADELRKLFEFASPEILRRTIEYLYFSHVSEAKNLEALPENFHNMNSEIYRLIDFLDKIEGAERNAKIALIQKMVKVAIINEEQN